MDDHDSAKCNSSEGLEIGLKNGVTLTLGFEEATQLVASKVDGVITQNVAIQVIRECLAEKSSLASLSERITNGESSFERVIEQFAEEVIKALN